MQMKKWKLLVRLTGESTFTHYTNIVSFDDRQAHAVAINIVPENTEEFELQTEDFDTPKYHVITRYRASCEHIITSEPDKVSMIDDNEEAAIVRIVLPALASNYQEIGNWLKDQMTQLALQLLDRSKCETEDLGHWHDQMQQHLKTLQRQTTADAFQDLLKKLERETFSHN